MMRYFFVAGARATLNEECDVVVCGCLLAVSVCVDLGGSGISIKEGAGDMYVGSTCSVGTKLAVICLTLSAILAP